ncbi:MAG: hypothetical protein ACOCP8_06210 [archaeon]
MFLKINWAREQIAINLTGTRRTINRKVIKNIELLVPEIEKQKDFIKILTDNKNEKDFKILEEEINKFKNDLVF